MISRLSFHIEFCTQRIYITENVWVFFFKFNVLIHVHVCYPISSLSVLLKTLFLLVRPPSSNISTFVLKLIVKLKYRCLRLYVYINCIKVHEKHKTTQ